MASLTPTFTGDLSTAITKRALSAYFAWEDRNYISQGKSGSNTSGKDPMVGGGGGGKGPINPEIVTSTPFDAMVRRPNVVNTSSSPGIVVHDRLLGNFLAAVSISLSSSINSINQKADETTEGIEVAKDGISQTYKKLEHSSDTLENKLDAIIDALRYSNNQERKLADERETSAKKTEQKMATDMSSANQILMQDMDNEEIRQMREDDLAEDDRGPITTTPPQNPDQLDIPFAGEFSEGGIASGPDSGYLAVLHGDEAVIPLDNNYTQGQPSAIGQKPIATMPMMAERGTDNSDSMTPTFRPNISMASPPSISLGSRSTGGSGAGDMLAKAIQLPSKAAGLVTMGLMNKVLRTENISPMVAASLKSMSSPIASAFGIPDVMSSNIIDQEDGSREKFKGSGGRSRRREKGLFARFVDFILGRREEPEQEEGTGGSLYGRGGSTTYNRMSVNGGTGGNTLIASSMSSGSYGGYVDAGDRRGFVSPEQAESMLANPERFKMRPSEIRYLRESMGLPRASNDTEFFTKNVAYNNAYDYLNSPNYGLRTSEIAYNMSMQDEVDSMVEGLVDPESQVVMNNANVNKDGGDQQIEYSAIAVRGNPLKDGTYISPYAV